MRDDLSTVCRNKNGEAKGKENFAIFLLKTLTNWPGGALDYYYIHEPTRITGDRIFHRAMNRDANCCVLKFGLGKI